MPTCMIKHQQLWRPSGLASFIYLMGHSGSITFLSTPAVLTCRVVSPHYVRSDLQNTACNFCGVVLPERSHVFVSLSLSLYTSKKVPPSTVR